MSSTSFSEPGADKVVQQTVQERGWRLGERVHKLLALR